MNTKRSARFADGAQLVVPAPASPALPAHPAHPVRTTAAGSVSGARRPTAPRHTAALLRNKAEMYDNLRKVALATRRNPDARHRQPPHHAAAAAAAAAPAPLRRSSDEIDSFRNQYTDRLKHKLFLVSSTRSEPALPSAASPMDVRFARAKFSGLATDFKVARDELDLSALVTPRASDQPGTAAPTGLHEQLPGPSAHHRALLADLADVESAPAPALKPPPVPAFGGNNDKDEDNGKKKGLEEEVVVGDAELGFYDRIEAIKQCRRQSESEYRRLEQRIGQNLCNLRGSL